MCRYGREGVWPVYRYGREGVWPVCRYGREGGNVACVQVWKGGGVACVQVWKGGGQCGGEEERLCFMGKGRRGLCFVRKSVGWSTIRFNEVKPG